MDEHADHYSPSDAALGSAEHLAAKLGFRDDSESLTRMLSMPSLAFDALAESHRRYIIRYLLDTEPPVTIHDLATYVASVERQTSPAAITAGERNEVAARLTHIHLPKLVAFDLVQWLPERDEIALSTDGGSDIDTHTDDRRDRRKAEATPRDADERQW